MWTLIQAHRGASGYAPENTLAAFKMAVEMGADGIELDVHFTKDRVVVVTHDDNVFRVSGCNALVNDLTLEELKKLDFSNHMAGFAGEKIPTLEEVLQLIKPTNLFINIELKTNHENPNGLEEATQALVEKYGMQDRILYSSFNHYSLAHMKEIAPKMPCGALYSAKPYRPWDYARSMGIECVHPKFGSVNTPDYLKDCHEAGIKCNVWTPNTRADFEWLLNLGVDGIITNYPDHAIAARAQLQKKD